MIAATPPAVYAPPAANYQDFDNGSQADCTIAAAGNLSAIWDAHELPVTAAISVQTAYAHFGAPSAGLYVGQVLAYWEHHAIAGTTISGWTDQGLASRTIIERDIVNHDAYISVDFGTIINKLQPSYTPEWTTTTDSAPIGEYHVVAAVGYNATGIQVISWGHEYTATWGWVATHVTDVSAVHQRKGE